MSVRKILETVPETEESPVGRSPSKLKNSLTQIKQTVKSANKNTKYDDKDFWSQELESSFDAHESKEILAKKILTYAKKLKDAEKRVENLTRMRERERRRIISRLMLLEGRLIQEKKEVESLIENKDRRIQELTERCAKLEDMNRCLQRVDDYQDSAIGSLDNLSSSSSCCHTLERPDLKRNHTDPDKRAVEGALMASNQKCKRTNTDPGRYRVDGDDLNHLDHDSGNRKDAFCQTDNRLADVSMYCRHYKESNCQETKVLRPPLRNAIYFNESNHQPQAPPRTSLSSLSYSSPQLDKPDPPCPPPRHQVPFKRPTQDGNNNINRTIHAEDDEQEPVLSKSYAGSTFPPFGDNRDMSISCDMLDKVDEEEEDLLSKSMPFRSFSFQKLREMNENDWVALNRHSSFESYNNRRPEFILNTTHHGTLVSSAETVYPDTGDSLNSSGNTPITPLSPTSTGSPFTSALDAGKACSSFRSGYDSLPRGVTLSRQAPRVLKKPRMILRSYSTPNDVNYEENEDEDEVYGDDDNEDLMETIHEVLVAENASDMPLLNNTGLSDITSGTQAVEHNDETDVSTCRKSSEFDSTDNLVNEAAYRVTSNDKELLDKKAIYF